LWDYERGVWQYDVICAIILIFIVFAPRQWFRDLPSHGESVFWIETELVSSFPEDQRLDQLGKVLTARTGKRQRLTRIEPILDSEQEIKGYMAFAQP
jgi:hypothetical protein